MLKSVSLCQLLVAAVVAFASSGSFAAPQTQFFEGVPGYSQTLTFNEYDGEDLTGVLITMDLSIIDGTVSADNEGVDPAQVTLELGASATISSEHVWLLNDDPMLKSVLGGPFSVYDTLSASLAAHDGDGPGCQVDGTSDAVLLDVTPRSESISGYVDPTKLASYQGDGTFEIIVSASQIMNVISEGGIAGCFLPVVTEGSITIEYIPEPISIALFGFGGLMISRRRRCEK